MLVSIVLFPGAIPIRRKKRTKTRSSLPSSPSGSDLEGRPSTGAKGGVAPESIQERLRYLADSWADVNLPSCGQIQVISTSQYLVWVIDNVDQIYYSPPGMMSQTYTWKKLENSGKVSNISSNQNGSVVWCVDRGNMAYYRIGIKDGIPQGIFFFLFVEVVFLSNLVVRQVKNQQKLTHQ